ncbi:MAG: hypothetical protein LBQ01_04295 [Prevotellaceae bacterium]|jgi:hypothetical protein|nr:hypothetical protein [Prevotellaceae bacterium]
MNLKRVNGCTTNLRTYISGLTCYGLSKEGVKRKLPNASLIVNELKQRFPGRSQAKKDE